MKTTDSTKKTYKTGKPKTTEKSKPDFHKSHRPAKVVKPENTASLLNSQFKAEKVPEDAVQILLNFDDVVQGVRPLNSRQQLQLPDQIRQLSHQLTDQRSERRLGYMNESIQLSAYVRYYVWWNLVRLTRLFVNLPETSFPNSSCVCLDTGTGPLTVINALWLARPELRKLQLTWYCVDVSSNSMALGEDVYLSIVARTGGTPWKIIRVKGSFGVSLKQKADFITVGNMLNELDQSSTMPPEFQTKKYYEQFKHYGNADSKYILIEPGVPRASRTLCLLRDRFIKDGYKVNAPCPHPGECPMNGFKSYTGSKNKWCNFAFTTEDAPAKLLKLSERAKLPKERATLSFIAVSKDSTAAGDEKDLLCRVTSDKFRMPFGRAGFYACSSLGLTLLNVPEDSTFVSGDLISVKTKTPDLPNDEKSGAKVIKL